ncbi:hypothetical protein [Sandaracinus amylolyticus]|uniref:hypothetical protein n=1 Tax=Sandaracinus amylolyticus TaxID=927083 RepID=UPI001F32F32E|nr:hypothetical protein [Sandaracinus amylolyticus]
MDVRSIAPIALRGSVMFEARTPTPHGLSNELELRPSGGIVIRVLDREGRALVQTRTTPDGRFEVQAPGNAALVEVRAQTAEDEVTVTRDAQGAQIHAVRVPASASEITVVARDHQGSFAGALHLLDTMHRGIATVRAWSGRVLPPVYAYWDRGVTREWSYYRGERPEGSGRFCVELLGGDPGAQATSDTDEHDEAIVLHELGHFVMDRLTGDSSVGGQHPRGALIDPGLAWEEGRATWFATAVLGAPAYRDTIGLAPHGRMRVDESLETPMGPRGIGSETSVAGILWDLADGDGTLPDDDADGIALGAAPLLQAMIEIARLDGAFPSLPTFLRFLVASGRVPEMGVRTMLARTGEPASVLPEGDIAPWPLDLRSGEAAQGKIDGLTQPAPSGGANRPDTGFDAIRAYRVRVERRSMLSVRLVIRGSGGDADRTDLDLELRDARARVLDAARGRASSEAVARVVEPGWYVVYVRDGGRGNRADYELHVTTSPR